MSTKTELRKTKEWLYFYDLNKAEEHIYGKTKYKEYIDSLVLSKKIDQSNLIRSYEEYISEKDKPKRKQRKKKRRSKRRSLLLFFFGDF